MAVGESIAGDTLLDAQRDLAKRARNIVARRGRIVRPISYRGMMAGGRVAREGAELVANPREVARREWRRGAMIYVVGNANGERV